MDEDAAASQKLDPKYIEAVPAPFNTMSGLFLVAERSDLRNNIVECRLINKSKRSIYFTGFSIKAPRYDIELLHNKTWKEYDDGIVICGNGLYSPMLPPGKSVRFSVCIPDFTWASYIRCKLDVGRDGKSQALYTEPIFIGNKRPYSRNGIQKG